MKAVKRWLVCGLLLLAGPLAALAEGVPSAWPQRPVSLIVPFMAGGATDTFARLVAPKLSQVIGQPVLIQNVVGAGGAIGARKLSRAAPDGHVLMYGGISETILIPLGSTAADYSPQDLQAVSIVASTPLVLAKRRNLHVADMDALIQLLRSSPQKYSYGSPGVGSYGHFMVEALARKQGLQLLHVPYKGSSHMLTDLAAGHIDFALTSLTSAVPLARDQKIDLMGISAPRRLPEWPGLPVFSESPAFAPLQISVWGGVFAPRGLPPEVAVRINAAVSKALEDEPLRLNLSRLGISLEKRRSPIESQEFFEAQVRQYQQLGPIP